MTTTTQSSAGEFGKQRAILSDFWQLLRFQPWFFLLVTVTKLFFMTLLPQVVGLVTRRYFDALAGHTSLSGGVSGLAWLLIGIGLARGVMVSVDMVGNRLFRHPLGALLRKNLLIHLMQRPAAQALSVSSGEAVSRFREEPSNIVNFIYLITFLIAGLLFALIALVVMIQIHFWVTVLVFAPLVSVVIIANQVRKRMERMFHASRAATDQITSFIGEIFGAVQAVQVATAEGAVLERFRTLNQQRRRVMLQSRLLDTVIEAVFRHITSLGAGLILLVAAQSMRSGAFSVGDFVLFAFYLGYINELVHLIGMGFSEFRLATVSYQRLNRLLPDVSDSALVAHGPVYQVGALPTLSPPVRTAADRLETLAVQGLTYRYASSGRGIEGIDLHLPAGSLTVITGRIGAGKSTLLKVLLGLLPKETGDITWNGTLVADPAAFFTPPRAAYTAQIPRLFSDTLRENILLGLAESEVDLARALHTVVLEPDLCQLEKGLETLVGPRGVKLSGGQVQRVAAARMLVRQAALLVFDDLSSALDVATEQQLWERLSALPDRPTCLAVSYRQAVLRRADQIVVLAEGRVIDQGRVTELLERCEEFQQLWMSQEIERA